MEKYFPDNDLARIHNDLLNAKEEKQIVVKALDLAYKLKGHYAPIKNDVQISRLEDILDLCEK